MTTEQQILLAKRNQAHTSNVLHLILTLVTVGLWIPIWVLVAISNTIERARIDKQLRRLDK